MTSSENSQDREEGGFPQDGPEIGQAIGNSLLAGFLSKSAADSAATARAWNDAGLGLADPDQAELAFHASICADPLLDLPHLNLALLKLKQRKTNEATAALEKMQELFPEHPGCKFLLALAWQLDGDVSRAIAALENLVQVDPAHDQAWELLRYCHVVTGDTGRVVETGERWCAARPDSAVAQYLRKAVQGDDVPERATVAFLTGTFDRMAPLYEAIQGSLDYQGPSCVWNLLQKKQGQGDRSLDVLDAGCGTGLLGNILRPFASRLTGVDLSGGMLDKARQTGLYDRLEHGDLVDHFADNLETYDLIVAVDAFCYFGDIAGVIPLAVGSLRRGGQLLFSLEPGQLSPDNWFILPNGRFAHSVPYIVQVMGDSGFPEGVLRRDRWRHENGKDHFALLIAIERSDNIAESGRD